MQKGASGSPRSLPLPQHLGALGMRPGLINDGVEAWGGGTRFAAEVKFNCIMVL